ncbi:actin-like ATPase domain-containing protein [Patellaria atrata CBS 101060]|uniref:Actin-like ATPase domain-containing protein n=1 Tax=Patellaria atrata CBS 101060 TaxID=1346257 RepID=A0A9P4VVH6_9PEZI|nr:actin-like ATPase domain-containing protein [Patellaria atrata CBS 101060]
MAPPGRRRNPLSLPSLFLAFCLLVSTASAASAVLGIDLGTSYIKAALVKPGIPLEIVLSKDSKRKEASAVAFKPSKNKGSEKEFPERLYGGDALALQGRFPGDVYPNLKPLLGLPAEVDEVTSWWNRRPALQLVDAKIEGRQGVGFKSGSFADDEKPWSVEELLAMELKNVRENAESMASGKVVNAVITVPAFYTAREKKAVELAAELAGLNVMSLVTDGVAVGINYATSRTFPSVSEGGQPEFHLVYDMGAGSTTATLLRFQGKTVKDVGKYNKTIQEVQVMATAWDKTLGGDALNGVIVDYLVDEFITKPDAKKFTASEVKNHGRTAAKLWRDAERVRQVLSANVETSFSFEGLYEDVDFRHKFSRTKFEELAEGFADRVAGPIEEVLAMSRIPMKEINSIILHGGAVRTPFVQKKLEALVGDPAKLRSNVNADEAAVFGAAFKGAGLSPSFKVKEIRDIDVANHPVGIRYKEGSVKNMKLFRELSQNAFVKHMPFDIQDDLEFTLYQQVQSPFAGSKFIESDVLRVKSTNLTASVEKLGADFGCKKWNVSTRFQIQISPIDGLPEVISAHVSCSHEVVEKKGMVENIKDKLGLGAKKDGQQEVLKDENGEEVDTESSPADPLDEATSSVSSSSEATSPSDAPEKEKKEEVKPVVKKKTEIIKVAFTQTPLGPENLSKEELRRMKDRLAAFDASDRSRYARSEALNTLEAFTYRARDVITEEGFIAASTSEIRQEIEDLLSSTSEWLYGEGVDAPVDTLKSKLKDLKNLVDPVSKRAAEAVKRPKSVELLQQTLDQTKMLLGVVEDSIASAAASAASLAAEASKSATEAASSVSSVVTPEKSGDELDELEEGLESDLPSTASSATEPATTPDAPLYSEEDLKGIREAYQSVSAWLEEKTALQEKLKPWEDSALSSQELEVKARELNEAVSGLLTRRIKVGGDKKAKSSKSKSKSKSAKASKSRKAEKGKETKESGKEKNDGHDEL